MPEKSFDSFLKHVDAGELEEAWNLFLDDYSGVVFQVIRQIERDSDYIPDCFQFVCEQLSANSLRRLRKFRPEGGAHFSTWLRAVVRNLCLDWRRRRFGRHRIFKSIARLSLFDQEVFRSFYERRLSFDNAFHSLQSLYPSVTHSQLAASRLRVEGSLSVKQRGLLDSRLSEQTRPNEDAGLASVNIPDPAPNPESQAAKKESAQALRRALGHLPSRERLLIRLRYEQELTLEQVANMLDLGNAQRADREIKTVLTKLRKELDGEN